MSYMMATELKIDGWSYGSSRLVSWEIPRRKLIERIQHHHMQTWGNLFVERDEVVTTMWDDCRKFDYKAYAAGRVALGCNGQRIMFPEPLEDREGQVVYAYWGKVALVDHRLIKIGYTGQNLYKYLASKEIAHDPILIAHRIGGPTTESKELERYRQFLEVGKEWFKPTQLMFLDFAESWDVVSGFDELKRRILNGNG